MSCGSFLQGISSLHVVGQELYYNAAKVVRRKLRFPKEFLRHMYICYLRLGHN
jgi:hypothetical protein